MQQRLTLTHQGRVALVCGWKTSVPISALPSETFAVVLLLTALVACFVLPVVVAVAGLVGGGVSVCLLAVFTGLLFLRRRRALASWARPLTGNARKSLHTLAASRKSAGIFSRVTTYRRDRAAVACIVTANNELFLRMRARETLSDLARSATSYNERQAIADLLVATTDKIAACDARMDAIALTYAAKTYDTHAPPLHLSPLEAAQLLSDRTDQLVRDPTAEAVLEASKSS